MTVMIFTIWMQSRMILLPKFDAEKVLKIIDKQRPTIFPGAPTMYIALINHSTLFRYNLSSIMACISGSAPLPIEIQQRFEQLTGGKLVEGYGLTETSLVTHAMPIWGKHVQGSIGLPWPNTEAAIVRRSAMGIDILPPGERGEIAIKGPQVMKAYWNRPKETEATFQDGWFLTGDIGYVDEKGYFYVVDRKKEVNV